MLSIQGSAKIFFEKRNVLDEISRRNKKRLSKAGSYVSNVAKLSLRSGARKSLPGNPPTSRTGKLRSSIGFALKQNEDKVIVGPEERIDVVRYGVPAALEYGGMMYGKKNEKNVMVAPRPFMGTALIQSKNSIARFMGE